ncbi:hypothetical protein MKW98_031014 [Papaver atlanticum]|uniref:Uncharacterized protein n=1 Tax=Papaver atlanticum TaxID=357466 RepID=A0AAD4XA90_9MAGN|nr:hypothetical protein MKW98_031014 [Papaver atlanticum]
MKSSLNLINSPTCVSSHELTDKLRCIYKSAQKIEEEQEMVLRPTQYLSFFKSNDSLTNGNFCIKLRLFVNSFDLWSLALLHEDRISWQLRVNYEENLRSRTCVLTK